MKSKNKEKKKLPESGVRVIKKEIKKKIYCLIGYNTFVQSLFHFSLKELNHLIIELSKNENDNNYKRL